MAGGTHICLHKFEAVLTFEAIQKHKINYCLFVPTMINMMLNYPDFSKHDFTSMKTCIYGGDPMPEALMLQAMQKLPSWSFYQIYGMTEAGGFATMLRWRDHHPTGKGSGKLRSAVQPAIGVALQIRRLDGTVADTAEIGENAVRSDAIMIDYLGNDEATRAVLKEGWVHTGDGGYVDDDGYLFIVDRIKDMIVSGGENVYSVEVERALYSHPAVREAAVIGIPHELWGEVVHAVVVVKVGAVATAEELVAHCRLSIAGYKIPRSIEFRSEALPMTPVGKIREIVLREPWWKGAARNVN
jgi:long-chain acyl-CoA synthetase